MKKILLISFLLALIILLNYKEKDKESEVEEVRGIFISYIELSKYVKNKESISKKNIDKMIKNIKDYNLNTIILQVRSSSDSIYKSNIFPTSSYIVENEGDKFYDVLDYFIKKSHENNIKLYAWINPYRVRTTNNIDSISIENPAYKYIGSDTLYINNGIYYNPSKVEVEKLILAGVDEVLEYNIDGLLFDDYFYPSSDIDIDDYKKYLKTNKKISLEKYHLNIVNRLIRKVYSKCRSKNIYFGISPEGNIENNYHKNYADVKRWMVEDDYIDFIMPQIYYGFKNSSKNYIDTVGEWENLNRKDLLIALAFYKVGEEDWYAKNGKNEWIEDNNIIMKELILARNLKRYKGFSLFRYDNIFDEESYTLNSKEEINNLKRVLK